MFRFEDDFEMICMILCLLLFIGDVLFVLWKVEYGGNLDDLILLINKVIICSIVI